MHRTFLILLPLLAVSAGFARLAGPFENTKWKINLICTDGNAKDGEDTISFKVGKFTSKFFEKDGFKECGFDEDIRKGDLGTFTAEQSSDKNGKLSWTGTVTAVEIRGEVKWTKPDGSTVTFSYNGERLPQK